MAALKKSRSDDSEVRPHLEKAYDKYGLVMLLGAGVSARSGLPGWDALVRRIMTHDQVFGAELGSTKYDALKTAGYRLETITGMAELKVTRESADRAAAKSAFSSIIRESLYGGPEFTDWWSKDRDAAIDITTGNARDFADFINKNQSLKAVYDLCVMFEDEHGKTQSKRNPNIHAIINFNLDALLSSYDKASHILHKCRDDRRLRTIERPTAGSRPDRISVYYPHGFLRFDRKRDELEKEAPDLRILTETEYYDFYNRSMEMYTYTLLHMFREYHCLFIGLSMTDENIRRLLHYSKDEERRSVERERPASKDRGQWTSGDKQRHFAVIKKTQKEDVDILVEVSLADLGVNVLWIDDFPKIVSLLGDLRDRPRKQRSSAPGIERGIEAAAAT